MEERRTAPAAMKNKSPPLILGLCLLLAGGCASVSADRAVQDVQRTASDRLGGKEALWSRDTTDDKVADDAVRHLLEAPLTVDAAIQVSLLNNKHLQAGYQDLGIAQAELVQAGLLDNPRFSADVLVGNNAIAHPSCCADDATWDGVMKVVLYY